MADDDDEAVVLRLAATLDMLETGEEDVDDMAWFGRRGEDASDEKIGLLVVTLYSRKLASYCKWS